MFLVWLSKGLDLSHGRNSVPPLSKPLFTVNQAQVVIDTIKMAQNGKKEVIVRLYESMGGQCNVVLDCGIPVKAAFSCNLLEEEEEMLIVSNQQLMVHMGAFEIKTLKLTVE
jgi:alpha-mannosidase